jgi:hypothetical protein
MQLDKTTVLQRTVLLTDTPDLSAIQLGPKVTCDSKNEWRLQVLQLMAGHGRLDKPAVTPVLRSVYCQKCCHIRSI